MAIISFLLSPSLIMAFYCTCMSVFLCSLLLAFIGFISSAESSKTGGITVDFIRRDSTPPPSSSERFQRLRQAVDRSFSRKSSFISSSISSIDAPVTPSPSSGEYLMKIKIGTPGIEQFVIADTGSDLLWIQCKPCPDCYKQTLPFFDPFRTSSYRNVSCHSGQCAAATGDASCEDKNGCQYEVSYGDGSYSIGEVASDTLTFDVGVSFPKIVFGCGHENAGTFGQFGTGIIGLGGGSISIINQLKSSIGGRFSYCLTLIDSNTSSKISFGSNAVVAGPKVVSTPLVKKSPATYYYLTLEGVSVGTERVEYMSETGTEALGGEGNMVIDSGTTLTFIPSELYDGVEAALVKVIKGTRVSDPQGTFKLCYKIRSGGRVSSPPVTVHFKGGADLVLAEENLFVEVEKGMGCLTMFPTQGLGIFGNLQQMNYHVGYDLLKKQVSFLQTDCSKHH